MRFKVLFNPSLQTHNLHWILPQQIAEESTWAEERIQLLLIFLFLNSLTPTAFK